MLYFVFLIFGLIIGIALTILWIKVFNCKGTLYISRFKEERPEAYMGLKNKDIDKISRRKFIIFDIVNIIEK